MAIFLRVQQMNALSVLSCLASPCIVSFLNFDIFSAGLASLHPRDLGGLMRHVKPSLSSLAAGLLLVVADVQQVQGEAASFQTRGRRKDQEREVRSLRRPIAHGNKPFREKTCQGEKRLHSSPRRCSHQSGVTFA
eukprot:766227-Hanusia_phi.AAC.1